MTARDKGRIAMLLPDLTGGGAEQVQLVLAREFVKRGHDVDFVLARCRGDLLGDVPEACRVIDLAAPRLRSLPAALFRYLRGERPAAVLAAMWPLTGIACMVARVAGVPTRVVVSEHADFRLNTAIRPAERTALRWFGPWIYRPAARVVAVSRGVEESLHETARLSPQATTVIHNPLRPIPPSDWAVEDHGLRDWWLSGGPRLVTVGRLSPQKAQHLLLEALVAPEVPPDARLVILGEGPLRGALEARVAALGLADRVRLPGFRHDPYPFFSGADLFVLPSRFEGFGNVLIEAMACGTPVVSTGCPSGPSEILADGAFGGLVPVGDVGALARGMAEALARPPEPEALKRRAQDFAPGPAAEAYLEAIFGEAP